MHESWGTEGDNKVQADLFVALINKIYEDAIHVLRTKPEKVEPKRDLATEQEEYYRGFRTNVGRFLFVFFGDGCCLRGPLAM